MLGSAGHSTAGAPASVPFRTYEEPAFPAALAMTPVLKGHATVVFTTDSTGRVNDAVILAASHPSFGDSVLTATQKWQLNTDPEAAATGSLTPARREVLLYEFHRHGAIISLTHRDSTQAFFSPSLDDAPEIRTVTLRELAEPPSRILSPNPKYPAALRAEHAAGSATVSFVIDATGTVRVPVVIAADRPEFGDASLEAIRQWRFSPPLQNGAPVNVEAERRFTFGKTR